MTRRLLSHPLTRGLQVVIGLLLLALLVVRVDFWEVGQTLKTAQPTLLLGAFLSFAAMILLDGVRIAIAFRSYSLSLPVASKVNLVGLFFANFTPGMVGGEFYRIYSAHRLRSGLLQPITLAATLRFLGMLTMLLLCALYILGFFSRLKRVLKVPLLEVEPGRLRLLVGGLVVVTVLALLALLLPSRLRRRMVGLLHQIRVVVRELGFHPLALLVLVSALMTAASCVSLHWLLGSLDTPSFLPDMIVVTTFLTFASFLPLSFGGLGVREGAIVLALAAFGVAPPTALTVALLNRLFLWTLALIGGVIFLTTRAR
jgi:hypothetical protein